MIFYLGPECVVSSDCPLDKACIQQTCTDPCIGGLCAPTAICRVVNHSPICSCPSDLPIGDPFTGCQPQPYIPPRLEIIDPCNRKYRYLI